MQDTEEIGIIVLAAGESKRFGSLKQLATFQGKSLLRRAAETAVSVGCGRVFVVLGAYPEKLIPELEDLPLQVVYNQGWRSGIMSSIHTGLSRLIQQNNRVAGVLIMLCDQPLVDPELINSLIEIFLNKKPLITASKYSGTVGVPAIFSSALFNEILQFNAKGGAKELLIKYQDRLEVIEAPQAMLDIDIPQDYEALLTSFLPKSGG
jgi:molybdenum cofactor cytidylyltransferase